MLKFMLLLAISMYAVYGEISTDCNGFNPLGSLNIATDIISRITNCFGDNYWSDEFPSAVLFQALIDANDESEVTEALSTKQAGYDYVGLCSEYPAFQSSVNDLVIQIGCWQEIKMQMKKKGKHIH